MKRSASLLFLLLLVSVVLVSFPQLEVVKAEGTIYIRANGTVEGTDKIQGDGNVYTFTDNLFDSIIVEKDDVVIDGAGYSLQGNGIENGITLSGINNDTVKNLKLSNFNIGIVIMSSDNNLILENIIEDNFRGLDLTASENNTLSGNYISHNKDGIALENMYNKIIENTITNNSDIGIFLNGAGYNDIIGNNITDNSRGILVSICYDNVIFHNNFVNNTIQVETDDSMNIWDNGEEGNYWDDYGGVDNSNDGVGDTTYLIDENNKDDYPLINVIPEFPSSWIILPLFLIATVVVTVYRNALRRKTVS
jgi:parallel beta-helix repeat protein